MKGKFCILCCRHYRAVMSVPLIRMFKRHSNIAQELLRLTSRLHRRRDA